MVAQRRAAVGASAPRATSVGELSPRWLLGRFVEGALLGALVGGLFGLAEAQLVAIQTRRPDSFGELFGYAVLLDAAALGLLGGLLFLTLALILRWLDWQVALSWLVPAGALLDWLALGALVVWRGQQVAGGGVLTGASPTQAALLMGACLLAPGLLLLGAWRARSEPARLAVAVRQAATGLALLLFLAGVAGVAQDLAGRLGGPSREVSAAPAGASAGQSIDRAASGQSAPASAVAARPNVLLVTVDSLRADRLGSYGHEEARTPTLDRLAAEGVRFERSYANRNGTTPSHASLFTGSFPDRHGVRTHMLDLLAADVPTLAEVLASEGYVTAGIYSWLAFEPAYSGLDRGFQSYEDLTINLPSYLADQRSADLAATYKRLKTLLALPATLDEHLAYSAEIEETLDGKADVTTDGAMLWLQEYALHQGAEGRPFFLWTHYWDPHYPFTPPPPFDQIDPSLCPGCPDGGMPTIRAIQRGEYPDAAATQHLLRYYDGEIAFTDQQLGRLLAKLDQLGLADNTLIVVLADHGESFGEQGNWLHGHDLYAPEIHVPLLMRLPGVLPSGRTVEAVSRTVDVMPTILELVDAPTPATVQGQTLLPLVSGEQRGDERFAVAELADRRIVALATRDWLLLKNNDSGLLRLFGLSEAAEAQSPADRLWVQQVLVESLDRWQADHP